MGMSRLVVIREEARYPVDGGIECWDHWVWCPGCAAGLIGSERASSGLHRIRVAHEHGSNQGSLWDWNGSVDAPTYAPSVLVLYRHGEPPADDRCHSFIRDGHWEFLGDSTHPLAGQTVPMVDVPAGWLG